MTEISFKTGMICVLIGWFFFRAAANLRSRKPDWKSEARQLIFLINLLVIFRFTFYPFSTINGQVQPLIFDPATVWPFRVNLIPFVNLLDYETRSSLLVNIIGNFAMFIPTGIVLPLIYRRIQGVKKVVLTGAAISLGIEILQLPFAVRASDVDDLILNTLGCLAGYGILLLSRYINKSIRPASKR